MYKGSKRGLLEKIYKEAVIEGRDRVGTDNGTGQLKEADIPGNTQKL